MWCLYRIKYDAGKEYYYYYNRATTVTSVTNTTLSAGTLTATVVRQKSMAQVCLLNKSLPPLPAATLK